MKRKKVALLFLSALVAVTFFGANVFAADSSSTGTENIPPMHFGKCDQDQTLAEWKESNTKKVNEMTEEMFSKMKGRMKGSTLTLTEWKTKELERINSMTEEKFSALKSNCGNHGMGKGRGLGMGLGIKMIDIQSVDYNTWKSEMIKNINSVSEEDFNKFKEEMKNFQPGRGNGPVSQ
jgi:hypothetical protein